MGFPWRAMTASSLSLAVYLSWQHPERSMPALAATCVASWLVQAVAYGIYAVFLWPFFLSPLIGLPEPTGNHWLFGQWKKIAAEPTGIPMLEWVNSIPNEGLIRYKGLMNEERLLVTSPKALADVLVTHSYDFPKPAGVRWSIGRILGVGVLLAEGDEHRFQRKLLNPAFAFRHVKDLYPVFWRKAREGVAAMRKQVLLDAAKDDDPAATDDDGNENKKKKEEEEEGKEKKTAFLEVSGWASRATLDIIGVAGLGRDFGAIRNPDDRLNRTYRELFKPSRQAALLALLAQFLPQRLVSLLPVRRNGDVNAAARYIRGVCRDLIREKKERLEARRKGVGEQQPRKDDDGDDDDEKRRRRQGQDVDILSVALESGGFSDENLVDQLMTFLAAGHETTATAMTWAVYMLSRYPDVQARLREEVRARLPPEDGHGEEADISALDIDHMPYLNAVCNEVLRYFAPVPMTTRVAARDTLVAGHPVPKGTTIILAVWATNKDKALWGDDALEFDPERWLSPSSRTQNGGGGGGGKGTGAGGAVDEAARSAALGGARNHYAFMTFLHGPRSCIGQGFAKAEFACLLAAWVGRFAFELRYPEEMDEAKVEIRGGVTARPARGLWVKATVLDGWE